MVEEISAIEAIKKEDSISEKEIEKRKKKIIGFLKEKTSWIFYGILAVIIFISTYIRTRSISGLKDITTGTWTLGPDLDPFLFLRWAQYIAEHGKLFLYDTMRYVPLANICTGDACAPVNTTWEMKLLSYMIAWFSKFLSVFNSQTTVTYAAVIFPVVMSVLTAIAFFLFTRKLFYKESKKTANIIALISTAFFVLVPSLLPRTIAGIPEKESAAFFFLFMAFYLFLEAYTSEKLKKGIIYSVLAGVLSGALGLIWGGVTFVFIATAGAVLFAFILNKIDEKKFLFYSLWLVAAVTVMIPFSSRYTFESLIVSSSTGLAFMVFFIMAVDFLIFKKKIFNLDKKLEKIKLPKPVISAILAAIIVIILASVFFGISFVPNIVKDIITHTIEPFDQSRFGVTVAENKQPYFTSEWAGEFGPVTFGIPLYFWLFFIGSVVLFNYMIKPLVKKEKLMLTAAYTVFLFCLIFSKYSSTSNLNGESILSLIVYFGGAFTFIASLFYVYYKKYKEEKFMVFEEFNFLYIFYFIVLTMMTVAARGAVRLIMVLGAVSPIAVGFLIVHFSKTFLKEKEETKKLFTGIVVLAILLASVFTIWTYYQSDKNTAENYIPGAYQWQWQKAMAWVRENTPLNAVFAHWWDYGYWVQSIGKRATILDGGNAIGYWNHMMGRYVLTGTDEKTALDFLYAHNGTHLLIDSTDIGKYGAFSSIGSDENYDRFSWIPVVFIDETQTQETSNETIHIYPIGTPLDEDIVLNENGKQVLLPRKGAYVAAVGLRERAGGELLQPMIFFIYNDKQYQMPMRYIYVDNKLYDFKTGINSGLFAFPKLSETSDGKLSVTMNGAALYLSGRTVNSELAKLYLFDEESDYFRLVHTEDSSVISEIKQQGYNLGDFVYYQGLQGPIKIWEIDYPSGMKVNQDYLRTDYPAELEKVIPGEY
jgi:asparagine N-glycosylation enzyme membrane subunit Stt3